jgi:hypothetical protein
MSMCPKISPTKIIGIYKYDIRSFFRRIGCGQLKSEGEYKK